MSESESRARDPGLIFKLLLLPEGTAVLLSVLYVVRFCRRTSRELELAHANGPFSTLAPSSLLAFLPPVSPSAPCLLPSPPFPARPPASASAPSLCRPTQARPAASSHGAHRGRP
ncbi:hypothetical protein FKP32DRAFT_341650 [Trametes sanguinea]|nr:hypothetical protein FKP32DRAFT_341650 [Trametes sanguinea]